MAGVTPRAAANRRGRRVFAVVLAALCLSTLAARVPLLDPDEGLHAAIAQEMLLRHDYVTPTFLGQPFLDKPIFFFWCEAASLRLFGNTEAAIRIPPLLFGVLGALSVAALARRLFGERIGLISGIVFATMVLPFGLSTIAVHDVALVPFECAAALAMWNAMERGRSWTWGALAGVLLGCSILTKGLVGPAFVTLFAGCAVVWRREWLPGAVVALAAAALVSLAVASPWYIAVEHAHPGYLRYYFVDRHLHGFTTSTQRHAGREWWYYLPVVIAGTLPWIAYAAGALRSLRGRPVVMVMGGWFLAGLVLVSAAQSKLATYVVPAIPALAMVIASYLDEASTRARDRVFAAAFVIHALVIAVLPAVALAAIQSEFKTRLPAVPWVLASTAMAGILVAAAASWRAVNAGIVERAALLTALSLATVMLVAAPYAGQRMTGKALADALNRSTVLPPRVSVLDERIGSIIFYLSPALRAQASPERISFASYATIGDRVAADPRDALVAVRQQDVPRFQRLFAEPLTPDLVAGSFYVFRSGHLRSAMSPSQ